MKIHVSLSAKTIKASKLFGDKKALAARQKLFADNSKEILAILKEAGFKNLKINGDRTAVYTETEQFGGDWEVAVDRQTINFYVSYETDDGDEDSDPDYENFSTPSELKALLAKMLKGKINVETTRLDDGIYWAKEGTVVELKSKAATEFIKNAKQLWKLMPYEHRVGYLFNAKPTLLTTDSWSSVLEGGCMVKCPGKGIVIIGCEND